MESQELYEVLGLQPFADGAMVDQAYWHLAKSFQTLAITDPRARQSLDDLNDAYGVLGTPRLREEYDETLRNRAPRVTWAAPPVVTSRKKGFGLSSWFKRTNPGDVAPAYEVGVPVVAPVFTSEKSPTPLVRTTRRSTSDVQDLQASTGAMLERWRASARLDAEATASETGTAPDTTLVDIFRTEQAVDDDQGPLNAVMDVLRSSKESAPTRS